MKLYHVSKSLAHDGFFEPRIPANRIEGEDESVPRICVSASVGGCLSAVPGGGMRIDEYLCDTGGFVQVLVFDTEELSIPDEAILTPDELYERDLVEDAVLTGEHWITVPAKATESYWLLISEWEETDEDVYPYEVERRHEAGEDFEEVFEEVCPNRSAIGHITVIDVTESYRDGLKKGDAFQLAYNDANDWFNTCVENGDYTAVVSGGYYCAFEAKEDILLRDLWEWIQYN